MVMEDRCELMKAGAERGALPEERACFVGRPGISGRLRMVEENTRTPHLFSPSGLPEGAWRAAREPR
jgi:hypothetical protein